MITAKVNEFQNLISLFDQKASTVLMTAGIMLPITLAALQAPQGPWSVAFQMIGVLALTGCVVVAGLSLWPRWSGVSNGASFVSVAKLKDAEAVTVFFQSIEDEGTDQHVWQLHDLARILSHKAMLLRVSLGLLLLAVFSFALDAIT